MSIWKKIMRFSTLFKVLTVINLVCLILSYIAPFVHPDSFKILPFFGLAYPVIVIGALVFMVIWAFARSRWFFYVLFVLVCGGNLHFRTLAITFTEPIPDTTQENWKIASYNVRLFDIYNPILAERDASRKAIIDYVRTENPDVVCFQEFFHQEKPTDFSTRDTLVEVLKAKDFHDRYSYRSRYRQNFGICMISKYPIIAKGDVMFENFSSTDNYCIFADIVKGKDTLRIYTIHLQSIKLQTQDYALFGEDNKQSGAKQSTISLLIDKLRIAYPARAEQAKRVVEHMKTSPFPVVICGDFNDTPMSYVYNQFNKALVDVFRETSNGIGTTYVGRVPAGRIDYIFHTKDLSAAQFKIQKEAHSDHKAISCVIWKKKQE